MGPIEKDLQEVKDNIRNGELVTGDYEKFNSSHDITAYLEHYVIEDTLLALLDELEEEHKTEIPQPVDADGVPWTGEDIDKEFINLDGDEHKIEKIYYNLAHKKWYIKYSEKYVGIASYCRHVKPKRSLEEIARDIDRNFQKNSYMGNLVDELHEYFVDDAE